MKSALKVLLGTCVLTQSATLHGATITSWNFNSVPPDTSTATGSLSPSTGLGTHSSLNVSDSFAAGSTNDVAADNSALSGSGFPSRTTGNKTAGWQFSVSTRGYSNIVVTYDQRNSASASRYVRFQYALDGVTFVDLDAVTMTAANVWVTQQVNLSGIAPANNNPNFAFRIVTEFEFTATNAGTNGYLATGDGSSYSTAGTIRLDRVFIAGEPLNPGNQPPTLNPLPDMATVENVALVNQPLIVGDPEAEPEELLLRAESSNTNLIPAANVVFGGSGANRTMTLTPLPDQFGAARITVSVFDPEGLTTNQSFMVTVNAANVPPTISPIAHRKQPANSPGPDIAFSLGDVETNPNDLQVTVDSSNLDLLPLSAVTLVGSGAERTLRLQPATGRRGTSLMTVTATDAGNRSARAQFVAMVTPTADELLWETFEYGAGSLVTNSAGFWRTHSGTTGQLQVVNGLARVSSTQTEDAHVMFPDGPATNGVLYASFEATFTSLPSNDGEYFAHWNSSSFRARLFARSANAAEGSFRLAIANGSANAVEFPMDLPLSNRFVVVLRYELETASTTLWINPASEAESGVTATDPATAVPVTAFGLRQTSGAGTAWIDHLKVARTFAAVVEGNAPGVRLNIEQTATGLEIWWPADALGFRVQESTSLKPAEWADAAELPAALGDRMVVRPTGVAERRFFRLVR